MSTIKELIARIEKARDEIVQRREAEVLALAFDQVALLKGRIQQSGLNSEGRKFEPYEARYSKERAGAGYQVEFVDFTRTGRLFANIRPVVRSSGLLQTVVVIEGGDDRSKRILAGAEKKRGNILEPTAEELDFIRQGNRNRILSKIQF